MKPLTVKTIFRCNELCATPTVHPLVSLIRLSAKADFSASACFGFYTIWLRKWSEGCPLAFGRKEYDFCDSTLIAIPPETCVNDACWKNETGKTGGHLLCFHPSVMNCLKTGKRADYYSFFRYRPDEALHLSQRERMLLEREMDEIEEELLWGTDEYSQTILSERITLLLDYVTRFYKRQFIVRHDANLELTHRADRWLQEFFLSGKARYAQLPTPETFARQFGCSPDYFNDLLKHETGKYTDEYCKLKQISFAEKLLKQGKQSIESIATELGFPDNRAFCALFKQLKGQTPEYFLQSLNPYYS